MVAALVWMTALGQAMAPPGAKGSAVQAPSFSVEIIPEGLRLVGEGGPAGPGPGTARVALGPVKDVLRHGSAVYAVPVSGGVVVLDAHDPTAPSISARLAEGRLVAQLAHKGENVLVVLLQDRSVLSFDIADPEHPVDITEAERSGLPAAAMFDLSAAKGHVLAMRDGILVIDAGTAAGFHQGEHVRILSMHVLSPQDQLAQQAGMAAVGAKTAVVALERVERDRSVAHLGRGDLAEIGDEVQGTRDELSESLVIPHWVPFSWRASFQVRPFLDLNNNDSHAVGLLTDATVAYYFETVPLRLEAGLEPLGLVAGSQAQHDPMVAVFDAAFASPYFEIGLGTGFSLLAVNATCQPLTGRCPTGPQVDPLIVETFRFGALDGLNLIWRSSIASSSQGFVFRSGRSDLNFPLATRITLFVDAGGGTGYAFGDIGARVYIGGNGGPGTVVLSGGLGGASISDNGETLAGPSVMFGLELRL